MSTLTAGIDLGGTHAQIGLVDTAGVVVARVGIKTQAELGFETVMGRLVDALDSICADAGVSSSKLAGVGLAAPGTIDPQSRRVTSAPNLGWFGVDPLAFLRERSVCERVVIENDVNAALLAESVYGAGRGASDIFGVWVGTGVGGAWIFDDRLYTGPLGSAGEIGMTVIDTQRGRPVRLEHRVSRKAVQSEVARIMGLPVAALSADGIARMYADNNADVRRVVNTAVDLLGVHIANALTLMSVPLAIIGGGLAESLGELYVKRIADQIKAHAHPPALAEIAQARLTALGNNAGLLGAAILARHT